ncbi:DUF2573 family protein [Jeotgalibacillus sp. R-1-5s-1]|uniref:DUF2573 family protein n=1 Tax=Jeotgalibacillus sp. R-1-5s-1 TaxID=2555897 RepID=UPI00106DC264|nr:DUF2573 family protein [Jeotgalibacillus sp. R-1-5s-1]TFD95883.1 DUF2573 family protein [Jeotgalibacillus sp. R-1-5s-1]
MINEKIDAMVEKYAELLTGDTSEESIEEIKLYILYNHIAKSMPALAKHWNAVYPEGKDDMKKIVADIQRKNKVLREEKKDT